MRKPVNVSVGAEESLLGKIGRLTVSIPENGPGEVLLSVRGGSEAFAAWSDEPIPRHSRVLVVEALSARSPSGDPPAGAQRWLWQRLACSHIAATTMPGGDGRRAGVEGGPGRAVPGDWA